jgi:hypothetical protein
MIVEQKPLEQRDFSPSGSDGVFDSHFDHQPTRLTERRDDGVAGAAPQVGPFRLTAGLNEAEALVWSVSSDLSTITDGTNGEEALTADGFDDFDTDQTPIANGTHYIYLEAVVSGDNLDVAAWGLVRYATAQDEVGFEEEDPDIQEALRLYIGKIVVAEGVPTVTQGVQTAMLLDWGFVNGKEVRVLVPHTVHPDGYVKPEPEEE